MIGALDKLLLVLPSNTYRAQRFLEAARKLGIQVAIATDSEMSAPDHLGMVFDRLDFCEPAVAAEEVAALARSYGITHALAVDEGGVEIAALANARLSGSGQGLEGVLATRDKAELRKALSSAGILQPRSIRLPLGAHGRPELAGMEYPLVVKPTKGSGSIGVTLAQDAGELDIAIDVAMTVSAEMKLPGTAVLIEEYVEGDEFAVEGMIIRGALSVLAIFEKPDPLTGPVFAETIYVTPPRIENDAQDAIHETVAEVARALALPDGPVHAEVRLTPQGRCVPIDVAARSIGGHCSDALAFAFSTTLEDLILANATGRTLSGTSRERQASGVYMIPVEAQGTLVEVGGVEAASRVRFVKGVELTVPVGTRLRPLPYDNRYLGFIFAKAPGSAAVVAALRSARELLHFEFDTGVAMDA